MHLSDIALGVGVAVTVITFVGSVVSLVDGLSRHRRLRMKIAEHQSIWERLPTDSPQRDRLLRQIHSDITDLLDMESPQARRGQRVRTWALAYLALSLPATALLFWAAGRTLSHARSEPDVVDLLLVPVLFAVLGLLFLVEGKVRRLREADESSVER